MKRLLILVCGTLALAALAVAPAQHLGGTTAVVYAVVACLLCLVPAVGTMVFAELAFRGKPQQQHLAFLGGAALRMMFVAVAAILLYSRVPFFQQQDGFILWVCVFYLAVLALETGLLASALAARRAPPSPGPSS
jgi:hypothetical protein